MVSIFLKPASHSITMMCDHEGCECAGFHSDQLISMISFSSFPFSNQRNQLIKPLVGMKPCMTNSVAQDCLFLFRSVFT